MCSSESKKQIARVAEMKREENEEREKKKRRIDSARNIIALYKNVDENGLLWTNEVPSAEVPSAEVPSAEVPSEEDIHKTPHKNFFNEILDLMAQDVVLPDDKFDEMLDFIAQGNVVTDNKFDVILDTMATQVSSFKKSTLDFICNKCDDGKRVLNTRWFIMWLYQHYSNIALQYRFSTIENFADTILAEIVGENLLVLKEIILQDTQYVELLSLLEKYGIKQCQSYCNDCNAFFAFTNHLYCIPVKGVTTHTPISAIDFICRPLENGNRRVDVLALIKWVFQHKPVINENAQHRNNELQFTNAVFTEIISQSGMNGKNPITSNKYVKEFVVLRAFEFDLMSSIFEKHGIPIRQCFEKRCILCNAFFASINRLDCIHKKQFTRGPSSNTK